MWCDVFNSHGEGAGMDLLIRDDRQTISSAIVKPILRRVLLPAARSIETAVCVLNRQLYYGK